MHEDDRGDTPLMTTSSLTDDQLDEILRRHQAREETGSDTTVTTADGVWEIRKEPDVWRRKPDGGWDPVPPLSAGIKA